MKHKIILSCIFSAGVFLTACQTQTAMSNLMEQKMTDGQIVKNILVADQGEMATAMAAKKCTKNNKIKRYATHLYNAHAKGLHDVKRFAKTHGIKPEASNDAAEIQSYYANNLKSLEASNEKDFDKNYLNTVIMEHQRALEFLDKSIKDSSNAKFTAALKKAHTCVTRHLMQAQKLKQQMGY